MSSTVIQRPNGWKLARDDQGFSIWEGDYLVQAAIETPDEALGVLYAYAGPPDSPSTEELEFIHSSLREASNRDLDQLVRATELGLADASEAKNSADFTALLDGEWDKFRVIAVLMAAVERLRKEGSNAQGAD